MLRPPGEAFSSLHNSFLFCFDTSIIAVYLQNVFSYYQTRQKNTNFPPLRNFPSPNTSVESLQENSCAPLRRVNKSKQRMS